MPVCRGFGFMTCATRSGTLAVRDAESIVELQDWLGLAEIWTTMRYTHDREQQDAAARSAGAFRTISAATEQTTRFGKL